MNFSEIKAFLGNKPTVNPNEIAQNQLREAGLKQATEGIRVNPESSISQLSSQTTVGLRIYNNSLNQNIQLDEKQPRLPAAKDAEKGLFDFEEIAKNVLRFVGGVISSAAKSGANEEKLMDLFEQARTGVAKGIKMAEKELDGFMNEEISKGISSSANMIERGIQRLQDELFGNVPQNDEAQSQQTNSSTSQVTESASYDRHKSGELTIRTKDGDEVTLYFAETRGFETNRQLLNEQSIPKTGQSGVEHNDVLPRNVLETDDVNPAVETAKKESEEVELNTPNQTVAETPATASNVPRHSVGYQGSNLNFTVNGELDEAELASIGQLVADADDLATTFFESDVKTAFNQALELGFDKQELAGFALQLTRQEQVEVVKTYESVSQYDGSDAPINASSKPVERVSDYLAKMLNVLEQSQQKLEDSSQYEKLINSLVNQIQNVDTNELVSAINDFHVFNNQLLNNLPNQKEQA
jgi:hypothetical protein